MAKKRIKISLATKLRLLFGVAVLGIIAAALVVPWYFTELLAEQGVLRPGQELTRLRLGEWKATHQSGSEAGSNVALLYTKDDPGGTRKGPIFISLQSSGQPKTPLDSVAQSALDAFRRGVDQEMAVMDAESDSGETAYRCFRAVRMDPECARCHNALENPSLRYPTDQLVGMIDVTLPMSAGGGPLVWWTRGAFVMGVVLAALLAFALFAVITTRLILSPVRQLCGLADRAAEGDLAARSTVGTGDELQRLGDSFNQMLSAISGQHDKLRSANEALDLRLHKLAEANVALFRANQVKNEFLANVSHELRTPLNSILGFSDLLREQDDDRVKRYGQNISTAAKNLLNMINDLLDLAKIEAGRAEIRFEKVSVLDTCQTLAALTKPLADKRRLELRCELDADVPIVVADAGKLQQILYNLLSNAIKFTPSGGTVTLSARRDDRAGDSPECRGVVVAVADTGPGIAEADQQRVFEKFYQADSSLTKESTGTGLGLAIARELTHLLGGVLSLKSSPGHGSVFTLWLALDGQAQTQSPPAGEAL